MMKKSGFIEGAIIATLAIFISKFLGIIYVIPFKSIVGDEGGALYGFAYSIYNIFLIISTAGIPLAISKLTSEYTENDSKMQKEYMFSAASKFVLVFSIVSFLICFTFAPSIAKFIVGSQDAVSSSLEDIAFVIRAVSFAVLVVPTLAISRGYLQGHGYMAPASFSQVVEQLVRILVIVGGSFVAYKVLHLSLRVTIGVAVFGACFGAIISYLYLIKKFNKVKKEHKEEINLNKNEKKIVIGKIISYAIPFILINMATTLYSFTDMTLVIRGLHYLNFSKESVTTISGIFTTYGSKMNMIITSIATGIALSLIPTIAKSNVKKDLKDINDKFNKTLQIFFYVALPLSIFMSIFATQIWTIFYGPSEYGPIIMRYSILVASVDALSIMLTNGSTGLNESKIAYLSVIVGLIFNLLLDLPLMFICNSLNIYPYYGAITATLIGLIVSLIIPLVGLKEKYHLNYHDTIKKIPKLCLVYLIMIVISVGYRGIINNVQNRLLLILLIGIIGCILLPIYYIMNKREIESILGKKLKDMIRRK